MVNFAGGLNGDEKIILRMRENDSSGKAIIDINYSGEQITSNPFKIPFETTVDTVFFPATNKFDDNSIKSVVPSSKTVTGLQSHKGFYVTVPKGTCAINSNITWYDG